MRTDERDLFNLIVNQRLQVHYQRRKKKLTGKQKKQRDELDDRYEELIDSLPKDQAKLIREHEDMVLAECAYEDILYYRGGFEDGLRFRKTIRNFLKMPILHMMKCD